MGLCPIKLIELPNFFEALSQSLIRVVQVAASGPDRSRRSSLPILRKMREEYFHTGHGISSKMFDRMVTLVP